MYDIKYNNLIAGLINWGFLSGLGFMFVVIILTMVDLGFVFFVIFPGIFMVIGITNFIKVLFKLICVVRLNHFGKLVKSIPYEMVYTGIEVNGVPLYRPVINYVFPSGKCVMLKGEHRFDGMTDDGDGTVDMVIDEKYPNNYFIDFEINRLSGNIPSDYYFGVDDKLNK